MFTLKLLTIGLALVLSEAAEKTPRLMFGQNANYQIKFPHHVLVGPCGGSIIHKNWILTTKSCIHQNGNTIEIKFERFYFGVNVFSFIVNNDGKSVTKHPFSDIALVKLPVDLQFDENLKEIQMYQSVNFKFDQDTVGVVPGFDEDSSNHSELKYGLFQFEPLINGYCKERGLIDEFTQLCTTSYYGYPGNPLCNQDKGSGLVVGWNENPLLIGIVSNGTCSVDGGNEIYTKVEAFIPWIETVSGFNFTNVKYPTTTSTTTTKEEFFETEKTTDDDEEFVTKTPIPTRSAQRRAPPPNMKIRKQ